MSEAADGAGSADAADAVVDSGVDAGAEWRRLSPLTIVAQLLRSVASAALPLGAVIYGKSSDDASSYSSLIVIPLVALAVLTIAAGLCALGWYRQRYRVGTSDVRLEKGLISRSARSVPFERIQDVSLEQKLIPRLLGLVEVRFETGAGGKDELKLDYVTAAQGALLRDIVRARTDSEVVVLGEPAAQAPAPEQAETLFAMDPRRLLTFGVFEFSLVVFAVVMGLVQQFDFLLPFAPWDIDGWEERLAGPGAQFAGLGTLARGIGIVLMIAGFVTVGFSTGIVRTVLRDFGFRLECTAKGFRRRRGLLTLTDVVMPVHRVQAVTVSTGFLRRFWGWHGLSFISLAQDAKSANHDVAPFAQMEEIAPIVAAAQFALPTRDTDWHRPSPRYYTDHAVIAALIPGIGAVAAILVGFVLIGLALAAFGALLVAREYWLWRNDRHALDSRQVLSKHGWLAPRLLIASRVKLHSVEIAQGPIARWRGYASLNFGLAGGRLSFNGLNPSDARELRAAVLESIAEVDFARLPR